MRKPKRRTGAVVGFISVILVMSAVAAMPGLPVEPLTIAASPSVKIPLEALGHAFESTHPGVKVRIHYASGLGIRQSIAGMQNTGRFFIETGPYHLVAPGNPELIDRLEMKYYVLPGTRRPYATVPLVLVVPESLADAPSSFEAFARDSGLRLAIADPNVTELGLRTQSFLKAMGLSDALAGRLYVAHDARGVLDHLLNGDADAGILFGSDAARERSRVRVVANSAEEFHRSIVYYMAMERYCPNRKLCQEFLDFIGSPEAQKILLSLGYGVPRSNK